MLRLLALASAAASAAAAGTCATNGQPCPPPRWAPEWSLTYSTICQPGNGNYFVPPAGQPWGLISLDWSVASSIWNKNGPQNGTIEATSTHNCQLIKTAFPKTKCFIYHNMELALEAQESARAVMYDPSKAYLFLQYQTPTGAKNGTVYNENGGPGNQFFWDYRVPDAADYYIGSVLNTTLSPWVDGTFTDDVTGLPAEHDHAPANMNMSAAEVADVQNATATASQRLIDAAVAAGKYVWQAFGASDGVGGGPSSSDCATWMSQRCNAQWQQRAVTQTLDTRAVNQSIASFLITRPPIAFLGFGWESDQRYWRSEFLWDVGQPLGAESGSPALCWESAPGVFTRAWSYGNVTLDCNTYTATIPAH